MNIHEIRKKYLDYFEKKNHVVIPSASLIPENDPTTLFTGSGMQPMLPYLLGEKCPYGLRVTDSQKCLRTQDIDEVGDSRHTTFFEMLGNWSLGDYFKSEQIPWMFEFLTKELGLGPERLYITCFRGNEEIGIPKDKETAELWKMEFSKVNVKSEIQDDSETVGIRPGSRIFFYGEEKNWWSRAGIPANMPEGEPGGPDTEIFWDFGKELGLHENSQWKDRPCHVNCDCGRFMEIGNNVFMEYLKTKNEFVLLSQKNLDFGGGLERMTAAINNNQDIFKISVFAKVVEFLEELSHTKYGEYEKQTYAFRVILDHLRAATFLIGDGAIPSNKDQGYFTRRLIRRAVRYARDLRIQENFCVKVSEIYISEYGKVYQKLENKKADILAELEEEEGKFKNTLEQGLKELNTIIVNKQKECGAKLTFTDIPNLFTNSHGIGLISAKEAFNLYQSYGFPLELINEELSKYGFFIDKNDFDKEFRIHKELSRAGAEQKFKGGLADHSEMNIKYHTATHLLQAALKQVLGNHIEQKGSNITEKRLRFDFSNPDKLTPEQIKEVEDLVNQAIIKDLPVKWEEMTVPQAKSQGAIGLFADKYSEKVKVYTIGKQEKVFSKEICGGPHVEHIGCLGKFKIVKEESSSAGIRRIKAVLE